MVLAVMMCLSGIAQAGTWTTTILSPTDIQYSGALGVSALQQMGWASINAVDHAVMWNGTMDSFIDLNPDNAVHSYGRAISNGKQVGTANFGTYDHAMLWNGSKDDWVDLNPGWAGAIMSTANGISGNQQVGTSTYGTVPDTHTHAGLWNGTAESWVDLNPTDVSGESIESIATATDGNQQVGYATFAGYTHAGLWTGSADTWVDLSPVGSGLSYASGVYGGHQVGEVTFNAGSHASMWSGTAESWVDLNPEGATWSSASSIHGNKQVGYSWGPNGQGACVWSGTADSVVYLDHAGEQYTLATGVYTDGNETWVSGYGYSFAPDYSSWEMKAMLWHYSNEAPTATIIAPNSTTPNSVNTPVVFSGSFTDPDTTDTHTAVWTITGGAQPVTVPATVTESNGSGSVSDTVDFAALGLGAGIYDIALTVTDSDGSTGSASSSVIVYDPNAGLVVAAGGFNSPSGAYVADPNVAGMATFEFACKYLKGASVPTTITEFQFRAARMLFHVQSCEWLIVSGARVQYKGSGRINGSGSYGYMLTAIDGSIDGSIVDKFRLKIWNKADGAVVYDNQMGASDQDDPTTPISFGNIVIRK